MKKPIQIKVDEADLTSWNERAEKAGLSLSAWIRGRCSLPDVSIAQTGIGPAVLATPKAENRVEPSEFTAAQLEVARRTGHRPGCECMHCLQSLRFFTPAKKEEPKQAPRGRRK